MRLIDQYRDAICTAIAAIPAGSISSYGTIARCAGIPGRARLVARLLAEGDHDDLPWHRVLRADGRIAFPAGSSGFREQARRLRAEGVSVVQGRVVRPNRAGADMGERDIDRLLWG
ncbi:MAG: MGMT family protein [Xanthomonadales bacterium]|nr:MGMT family protein [Xanthomonadales bacterium]